MDTRLDFLFYNKARERFYNWADSKLDMESVIRFHAIYADPFVSKSALTRIIRVWASAKRYKVLTHTSILDFSDDRNQLPDKNVIHLVWIPVRGWKYFNSVREFASEKFTSSKIIFLPQCDKLYQKRYLKGIYQGLLTCYPDVEKLEEKHDKIFMEDKIQDQLISDVLTTYNSGINVVLVWIEEGKLPDDYMKYLTGIKCSLRKKWIRTSTSISRDAYDLNLLDTSVMKRQKKRLFLVGVAVSVRATKYTNTWYQRFRYFLEDNGIIYKELNLSEYFK